WRNPPPGRKWVPGHYVQVDNGYEWVSGFWAPAQQNDVTYDPQPPNSIESGPSVPAPSDNAIYNPGTWVYQDSQYLSRSGFYLDLRPGWVWHRARYIWTPAGFVFVDGYWDFPLATRGLLFAPVACDPAVCFQPNFVFQPACAFPPDTLTSCLFVRPGWGHYFVGDFFGADYRRQRFTPFFDFRFAHGAGFDPLFAYYSRANVGRPWERDMRALYPGRDAGTIQRPPRTLVQQNTFIQNLTSTQTTINTTNVRNVTMVSSINRSSNLGVALTRVTPQQVTATRQVIGAVRDL